MNKRPYLCYTRIDPHQKTQGLLHSLDMADHWQLARSGSNVIVFMNFVHLLKDRLCCFGYVHRWEDPNDLQRGVYRKLCLAVFGWSKDSDEMTVVASAVIEIRDQQLSVLPINAIEHQTSKMSDLIHFIKIRKALFSIFLPSYKSERCLLIHCMHGQSFVPITGNRPTYPGLYFLDEREHMVHAENTRDTQFLPCIGRVSRRLPDGSSAYQFWRLDIR